MTLLHVTRKRWFLLAFLCLIYTYSLQSQTKTLGLLKKQNGNDENGYLLFSPIGSDTTYLMNKCGQRLHSWRSQHSPGMSLYLKSNGNLLKSGTYTDTSFGFAGGRGGIIEEFDWSGNLLWRYKIFNDSLCQHHDIKPLPNGNVLVLAWHSISKNKAVGLGRDPKNFGNVDELWGERIIELKPIGSDSAEIVWQWDIFDHIVQDLDSLLPHYGTPALNPGLININYAHDLKNFDWIHANSIDYNAVLDQIVISCHNLSEIWIIDHSTSTSEAATHQGGTYNRGGDILYRWGNPEAYGYGGQADRKLFRQHNAQWIPGGYRDSGSILLFNNGWGRDTSYSTVDIIRTPRLPNGSYTSNLPFGPTSPAWQYKDSMPKKFYSQIISGAQMLPNGNVLICSGVQGRFFEVTENKKIVWEYKNPANGNDVQQDGQTANNNAVFRCEYYPKTNKAFYGKTLYAGRTIEKASLPYSCNYETTAPVVKASFPANKAKYILPKSALKIIFSESVIKRTGYFNVFADNILFESVTINSDKVKIHNDTVSITLNNPLPFDSRISVLIPAGIVRDSSFNQSKSQDSSLFTFNTVPAFAEIVSLYPGHQAQLQKPDVRLKIRFNRNVYKRQTGNVVLLLNGQTFETIPVGSSAIKIQGNEVTITPSVTFSPDAFIMAITDTCFSDSFSMPAQPIAYGNWYFRIANKTEMTSLSPETGSQNTPINTAFRIGLSRPCTLARTGLIHVYANGTLFETMSLSDTAVQYNDAIISFRLKNILPQAARINVAFPGNAFIDSFGLYFEGLDSAEWHFNTIKNSAVKQINDYAYSVFPQPAGRRFYFHCPVQFANIQLLDISGRPIQIIVNRTEDSDTLCIELPELPNGIYVLNVDGRTWKIAIQH